MNSDYKNITISGKIGVGSTTLAKKVAEILISMSFPVADLGSFDTNDNNLEFLKLFYVSTIRLELLIDFLKSNPALKYLEESLFNYFKVFFYCNVNPV